MDVGLDGLAGDLLGRLEQRADVDVEAEVGERRGDHLLAAVVAVLAHLGDEDARPPARGRSANSSASVRTLATLGDSPTSLRYTPVIVRIAAVWRPKTSSRAPLISPTVASGPGGVDGQLEQVLSARSPRAVDRGPGGGGQAGEGGLAGVLVALGAQPVELGPLLGAHGACCRP